MKPLYFVHAGIVPSVYSDRKIRRGTKEGIFLTHLQVFSVFWIPQNNCCSSILHGLEIQTTDLQSY